MAKNYNYEGCQRLAHTVIVEGLREIKDMPEPKKSAEYKALKKTIWWQFFPNLDDNVFDKYVYGGKENE